MTTPEDARTMRPVTDLDSIAAAGPAVTAVADAAVRAADAALAAGVRVRELTELSELAAVRALYEMIWRPSENPPVTTELLRALGKAGNYVAGAFDGAELVGACVGFFTPPSDGALHSHIAGVSAQMQGRHVGYALKLHQRSWALSRGVGTIEWTFDPLVARNAYFNVVKLGGRPAEYLPNFYGGMRDGINGDDDTDRLLLRWDLADDRTVAACSRRFRPSDVNELRARGAVVALGRADDDRPVLGSAGSTIALVAVPCDVETLRAHRPAHAREWRVAVRDVLGGLLADGGKITGFDRTGWYVVERDEQ